MEADWEIELGGGAPVIEPKWPGFVDLQRNSEGAYRLQEAATLPRLAEVLLRLNGGGSPVWTCKCDLWTVSEFDRDELDSPQEHGLHAVACYVDILQRSDRQWDTPAATALWCAKICALLKGIRLRCCRADLIVRHAALSAGQTNLGITAYVTACGSTAPGATQVLATALAALADSITSGTPPETAAS
jgi:hypothetical protein